MLRYVHRTAARIWMIPQPGPRVLICSVAPATKTFPVQIMIRLLRLDANGDMKPSLIHSSITSLESSREWRSQTTPILWTSGGQSSQYFLRLLLFSYGLVNMSLYTSTISHLSGPWVCQIIVFRSASLTLWSWRSFFVNLGACLRRTLQILVAGMSEYGSATLAHLGVQHERRLSASHLRRILEFSWDW